MKNKNLRRLSVLVNSQTEYHLHQLAQMAGYKEIGRVIDKLVREKMITLKGGGTDGISGKSRAPEEVSDARCENSKSHRGAAGVASQGNQNHSQHLTGTKNTR